MSAAADRPRPPSPTPTALRLAIARQLAAELRTRASVQAVLATGSAARGRCSTDSDLDLTVITHATEPPRFESRRIDGVTVDVQWLPLPDALAVVAPVRRDIKGLRDAARLGQAWVAFDRGGVADRLSTAAAALRPDRREMRAAIEGAYRTLVVAIVGMRGDASAQWDALCGIYDVVTYVVLQLTRHRYQKPKWVVHDLRAAGEARVLRGLLDAYGAREPDADAARRVADATEALLEAIARRTGSPAYHATLRLGYTEQHARFSFLCRCVEDARSLIADRAFRAAVYTARTTSRMAVAYAALEAGVDHPGEGGTLPLLAELRDETLMRLYADVWASGTHVDSPDRETFERCRRAISRARRAYRRTYPGSGRSAPPRRSREAR